jgi:uncharacterized protein (DUF433 family)
MDGPPDVPRGPGRYARSGCVGQVFCGVGAGGVGVTLDRSPRTPHISVMQMRGFPRLAIDPAVCGGRPVVAGTRMRVVDVLKMLADGASEAEIVADFPYVTVDDVRACLRFSVYALN